MTDQRDDYTDEDMFRVGVYYDAIPGPRFASLDLEHRVGYALAYRAAREAEYADPVLWIAKELSKASGQMTNPQFWEDVARRAIALGAKLPEAEFVDPVERIARELRSATGDEPPVPPSARDLSIARRAIELGAKLPRELP
jgi:hypothetical protein